MTTGNATSAVSWTRVNGVRIAYQETGIGEPLVLVHGSWGSHHNWDRVVGALAARHRVISYDRRGHSESERPPGQGTFAEDVADLAALMDTLDAAPAWVIGNSVGAVIALQLAATRPEVVRGLVVHEPPLRKQLSEGGVDAPLRVVVDLIRSGDHAGATQRFVEDVALGPGAWALLPEELRWTMIDNAPTFLDEELAPDSRIVDEAALAQYAGPVLVTSGSHSPPIFRPVLEHLERLLPQSDRIEYAGAGHLPHATHPAQYAGTVLRYVQDHGPQVRS